MSIDQRRRRLLLSATAAAGASTLGIWPLPALAATGDGNAASPQPAFGFDHLIERARRLAALPYTPPRPRYDALLDELGYEVFRDIHTRKDRALWCDDGELPFVVEFFHLDNNARQPVDIHVINHDGTTRCINYDPDLFEYADPALARRLPADLGFAGLRIRDRSTDRERLAFKGASYFRSSGTLDQYGLSARGAAVDTGYDDKETFPRFSAFWLFKPRPGDDSLTICALLEGERLTGAYRMQCRLTDNVIMDIQTRLFQRAPIRRLGIAPLTSMFWFSETNSRRGPDWRPEIHDSDGLAVATGTGERIWRALDNPVHSHYSAFGDQNPRGFGLLQRDRHFDHYQDARVRFERRPGLWVEPADDWGQGHVGLLELPTDEEVYDNINVFWVPGDNGKPGQSRRFDYRLHWTAEEPDPPEVARVVATRTGRAGEPGTYESQDRLSRKFVIDFEGGALAGLDPGSDPDHKVQVHATASHGEIVNPYPKQIEGTPSWRAFFDWHGSSPPDNQPVELRCQLRRGDQVLTETWLFAYFPQPLPPRVARRDS